MRSNEVPSQGCGLYDEITTLLAIRFVIVNLPAETCDGEWSRGPNARHPRGSVASHALRVPGAEA